MSNSFCEVRVLDDAPDGSEKRVEIRSSFNEDFIKSLKEDVPFSERRYDPELKRWYTTEKWLDHVIHLAKTNYDDCRLVEPHKWTDLNTGREVIQNKLFDED